MTYMTVQQAAEVWGVTVRQVQIYCTKGRIPGAQKFGMVWQIPADASKPADAPDEYSFQTRAVSERHCRNAKGPTAGYRHRGVSLFQRTGRKGGPANGALPDPP